MAPPKSPGYARGTQVSTSLTNRETFGGNSKAGLGMHLGMGQFSYNAINNGTSGHSSSTISGSNYKYVTGESYPPHSLIKDYGSLQKIFLGKNYYLIIDIDENQLKKLSRVNVNVRNNYED